ncbi:MAG: cupin domain-containing protein [Candidatus Thorarchaeota archaeon]|jgi:quercetin dioxygenase-like cupin family protein
MVSVYRARDSKPIQRAGYEARYFADIEFRKPVDSCGVILVTLKSGATSSPHSHEHLQEVFLSLSTIRIQVDNETIDLEHGDVIVVEPGETHSFTVIGNDNVQLIAMKFPNRGD